MFRNIISLASIGSIPTLEAIELKYLNGWETWQLMRHLFQPEHYFVYTPCFFNDFTMPSWSLRRCLRFLTSTTCGLNTRAMKRFLMNSSLMAGFCYWRLHWLLLRYGSRNLVFCTVAKHFSIGWMLSQWMAVWCAQQHAVFSRSLSAKVQCTCQDTQELSNSNEGPRCCPLSLQTSIK